jgi:fluoride exporter
MFKDLTILAVLGAAGTLARYGLSGWVQRLSGASFPWGTLAVNALGCFLLGIVWTLAEERLLISGQTRALVLIGFTGAFTTFSSFAFETVQLLRDGEMLLALGNVAVQNVLGVFCVVAGIAVGRAFF